MTKLLSLTLFALNLFLVSQSGFSQTSDQPAAIAVVPTGEAVEIGIYCDGVRVVEHPSGIDQRMKGFTAGPPLLYRLHSDWRIRIVNAARTLGAPPEDDSKDSPDIKIQRRINRLTGMITHSCREDLGYIGQWASISALLAEAAKRSNASVGPTELFDPNKIENPVLKAELLAKGDAPLYDAIYDMAEHTIEQNYGRRFGPRCSVKFVYVPTMNRACKK